MGKLKIVTFNIRTLYSSHIDGVNSFIHRGGMILEKIRMEKPHIICFQEVSDPIREFLNNYLTDYIILGHGRNADLKGEGLSFAYRKDSVEALFFESFWLSPTPYVPASRYKNQSDCPRICPHIVVKHKDMKAPISLYNVHLDHIGEEARIEGIRQIVDMISEYKKKMDCPTFILGDFNAYPDSETVSFLKAYNNSEFVDLSKNTGVTYHAFRGERGIRNGESAKIDYIFTDKVTARKPYTVTKWEDSQNGIFLSDHYPICLEIEI